MEERDHQQKSRLNQVSACVLDAVLVTSFDWRELANRLATSGRLIPQAMTGIVEIPHRVYRLAHTCCQADENFCAALERRLNILYAAQIAGISQMTTVAICQHLKQVDLKDRRAAGGFLWAILSDSRPCIRKISDIFVRRMITEFYSRAFYSENQEFDQLMHSSLS